VIVTDTATQPTGTVRFLDEISMHLVFWFLGPVIEPWNISKLVSSLGRESICNQNTIARSVSLGIKLYLA
jgi:hypothetical protein